jgi:NitT/TauT family transport system ATP-binding protein
MVASSEAETSKVPSIVLQGVSKTYGEGARATVALAPLDLTIDDGEFVAIVGPSGCGKSTLLRIIAGLIPRSSGALTVFGKPVAGPVTDLGIVFQQPILLDWLNVLDNVLFQIDMRGLDKAQYRARALDLLSAVGLADFADRRPYELSGGMKQRASIARGLVHEPPLLMMDEPFGALDALTREQMRIDLERLWMSTRKTILFITHSIDEAVLLADRVVVMSPRPGRVEMIIPVDLPRPRGLAARKDPRFVAVTEQITEIFLERGVLQRQPG